MRRRSKIKLGLVFVVLAAVAALLWRPIQQARAVAALQGTLQSSWELRVGKTASPEHLPQFLDERIDRVLERMGWDHERRMIFREQFRGLFYNPIDSISITSPVAFTGDIGVALARFPRLRNVGMFDQAGEPLSEADWIKLCRALRACPGLEYVWFDGVKLTDTALAELARHPTLRSVTIQAHSLTPASGGTFSSLPRLISLEVREPSNEVGTRFSEADWLNFCAAIRKAPSLEELALDGEHLTDSAIAPLAGQATLCTIRIMSGHLTSKCAATLSTIPSLTHLQLGNHFSDPPVSPEDGKSIITALPSVQVTIP